MTDFDTSDRHPSRQGTQPETNYQMQHDIYSLGVVLLEIGLWTSFVLEDLKSDSPLPFPNSILCPTDLDGRRTPLPTATENKQTLENIAQRELPARFGRRYTDIVLLCLRCLDPGNETDEKEKGFGVGSADWTDEDGLVIGVRFIENVLEKMQEITM
jgi:serine/threonine protein kinase